MMMMAMEAVDEGVVLSSCENRRRSHVLFESFITDFSLFILVRKQ